MCGIVGVLYKDQQGLIDPETLKKMISALRHRGPDDEGQCIEPGIALGHTRLSIIDLDGGRQPLSTADNELSIVFNGEIYNHRELRQSLRHTGHIFHTNSDTETILLAYREFGDECVNYLNGMFTFAIWDRQRRRLFLARDRFGIKPLHYTETPEAFLFSSEIQPLLFFPGVHRQIDLVSLHQYFTFDYVPSPRTMFRDIKKFPAGHYLVAKNDSHSLQQYWDVRFARSESRAPVRWSEYEGQLRENLLSSVKKELVSDVPVGVFISGGVDSAAVAAAMRQATNGPIHSFSVALEDPSFDESHYARLMARHIGATHHEFLLTNEAIVDAVERLGGLLDEPLADSSLIPTHFLAKFTREHVKVALSGDGGDELFAGYPTLRAHQLIAYYERVLPRSIRARLVPWIINSLPVSFNNLSSDFKLKRFVSGRGLPLEIRHYTWSGTCSRNQRRQLFAPWVLLDELDEFEPARIAMQKSDAEEALNKILYCDIKLFLESDILAKVDRASMAESLEVRVPLLNRSFAEHAIDLPFNHKLPMLRSKDIFKRALTGLVPREILQRRKKGFNFPVAKLLQGPLRPALHAALKSAADSGYFSPEFLHSVGKEHESGLVDHRKLLWSIICFEAWRNSRAIAA